MAYTDVISLANAKIYLGVDDTSRDTEITRMINGALTYLERVTNIIVDARDKTYFFDNSCVRVYDYPINTSTFASTVTKVDKGLYSVFTDTDSDNTSIVLNVGHTDVANIPADWVECGYAIIECLYNGGKLAELPELISQDVNSLKRFII